jgi:glycosyltransferase involved in cell wall biosynthesis
LRIGIDARYLYDYLTGIGRYSLNLIRHLAAIDRENLYFIFKNHKRKSPIIEQENFTELPFYWQPISLGSWLHLPFILAKLKLDIFHSHFPVSPLIQPFKSVITVHDLQAVRVTGFHSKRPLWMEVGARYFYRMAYPLSMKKAIKIITMSHSVKKSLLDYYHLPEEKIYVIPMAVEEHFRPVTEESRLTDFRKKNGLPSRFILNVGNTRPHKNVNMLLRGFHEYRRLTGDKDLHLVIAGVKERFYPERQSLTDNLGIRPWVHFISYIQDEDLPLLYSAAKLFVIVSLYEGFGFPPLEAMACGVPVIASNHSALPEVLRGSALFVDPKNPREIGGAVKNVMDDELLRKRLQDKGYKRVKEFSWFQTARQTSEIYEDVYRRCKRKWT